MIKLENELKFYFGSTNTPTILTKEYQDTFKTANECCFCKQRGTNSGLNRGQKKVRIIVL